MSRAEDLAVAAGVNPRNTFAKSILANPQIADALVSAALRRLPAPAIVTSLSEPQKIRDGYRMRPVSVDDACEAVRLVAQARRELVFLERQAAEAIAARDRLAALLSPCEADHA